MFSPIARKTAVSGAHDDQVQVAASQQVGVGRRVHATIDVGGAVDLDRGEVGGDRAGGGDGGPDVGGGGAGSAEHDPAAVPPADRDDPQLRRRPGRPVHAPQPLRDKGDVPSAGGELGPQQQGVQALPWPPCELEDHAPLGRQPPPCRRRRGRRARRRAPSQRGGDERAGGGADDDVGRSGVHAEIVHRAHDTAVERLARQPASPQNQPHPRFPVRLPPPPGPRTLTARAPRLDVPARLPARSRYGRPRPAQPPAVPRRRLRCRASPI